MRNYLLLLTIGICFNLYSCSNTKKSNMPNIPPPPQNINITHNNIDIDDVEESATTHVKMTTESKNTTEITHESNQQRIEEDRGLGGSVSQIKVDNKGKIPSYYIYPPLQQDLNLNSAPNKSVATPSWQINW